MGDFQGHPFRGNQWATAGTISVKEYGHGGASVAIQDPSAEGDESYLKNGEVGRLLLGDAVLGGKYLLVEDVLIRKDARGSGAGRRLYKAAIEYAKSKGMLGIASGGRDSRRNIVTDNLWKKHRSTKIGSYDVMTVWRERSAWTDNPPRRA